MLGEINENLAKIFGVHIATFMRWMQRYPEFREAIKKGRQTADQAVAIALHKRAIGFQHPETGQYFPPDTAAAFIWLKNRRPDLWRDKPMSLDSDLQAQPIKYTIVVEDGRRGDADNGE